MKLTGRSMRERADAAAADAEDLRDRFIGEIGPIAQNQHGALRIRQAGDQIEQMGVMRRGCPDRRSLGQTVAGSFPVTSSVRLAAQVDDRGAHVGRRVGEARNVTFDAQEGVLHEIVAIWAAVRQQPRQPEGPLIVRPVELGEVAGTNERWIDDRNRATHLMHILQMSPGTQLLQGSEESAASGPNLATTLDDADPPTDPVNDD